MFIEQRTRPVLLRHHGGEQGFTLIEVLVAFAIAVLALSLLFQGAMGGLRAASVSGRYEEALSRARSHLASIGAALTPADTQGDEGGGASDAGGERTYHWRVRITPIASAVRGGDVIGGAPAVRTTLYEVQVAISWQEARRKRVIELDTKRLGVTVTRAPEGGAP